MGRPRFAAYFNNSVGDEFGGERLRWGNVRRTFRPARNDDAPFPHSERKQGDHARRSVGRGQQAANKASVVESIRTDSATDAVPVPHGANG